MSILTEGDSAVPVAKMRELAHAAADKIYIDDDFTDSGFHDNVRGSLSFVTSTFSTISCALVDGQYGMKNLSIALFFFNFLHFCYFYFGRFRWNAECRGKLFKSFT